MIGIFSRSGVLQLLSLAFCVVFAVAIVRKQKDMVALVGAAGLVLTKLIALFMYFSLGNLLCLLAYAALLGIVMIKVVPTIDEEKIMGQIPENVRKYTAYIPAAVMLAATLAYLIQYIVALIGLSFGLWVSLILRTLISGVIEAALLLVAGAWTLDEKLPVKGVSIPEATAGPKPEQPKAAQEYSDSGYFDLAMHVILLLITCGIWQYIWIYRTTKYLNNCPGEEDRDPTYKLLLCMFIPFYYIYWTYKSAQRVDKLSAEKGIPCDIATLCLILSIFIGIVPPILIQMKMNALCEAPKAAAPQPQAFEPAQPVQEAPKAIESNVDVAEEIRKFKELLDSGAITEEEYEVKKKQLLDM